MGKNKDKKKHKKKKAASGGERSLKNPMDSFQLLERRVAALEESQRQKSIEEAQKRFEELIQKYLDNPNRLKF